MFFDDPQNRLSVARTHQRDLLEREQMDRLARQVDPGTGGAPGLLAGVRLGLVLLFARGRRFLRGTPASRGSATIPTPEMGMRGTPDFHASRLE
jgi:hypothetical protein